MMQRKDPYALWTAWITAFEQAVASDNWSGLGGFLTDDVVYRVNGAPFDCQLRGREAVVAGFARSVRGFDRHFAQRAWSPIGIRVYDTGYLTCRIHSAYHLDDAHRISFEATGHWGFRDDKIDLMLDFYDAQQRDVQMALGALAELGDRFDPRYTA
jgi:hypothetical protein